jgi:hypothetical protein
MHMQSGVVRRCSMPIPQLVHLLEMDHARQSPGRRGALTVLRQCMGTLEAERNQESDWS